MRDELQQLVDALAHRLSRSVAVDDRNGRLLAYSSHASTVDDVRQASIMTRQAPADAWAWAMAAVAQAGDGPARVPANAELGMEARVGLAVSCQGTALGHLWLLDPDGSLGDRDLDTARIAADSVGTVLYRRQLLAELELDRERELLRDLLDDRPEVRAHAADELVETNLFAPAGPVVAIVVRPVPSDGEPLTQEGRLALGIALRRVRSLASPRQRLQLVRPDHGLFLCSSGDPALPVGGPEGLGERLREATVESLGDGADAYVGIGSDQAALIDAVTSYQHARQAVRVAEVVRGFDPVTAWSGLGIYRLLAQLPADALAGQDLHPGLARLLETDGGQTLAATLECYFDLACDAKAAAAKLFLHRASLYYRLHKVEEVAGVNLKDGDDRLALHLGLKLARLAGVYPTSEVPAAGGRGQHAG